MTSLYILTDPAHEKNNEYKVGIHSGDIAKLIRRYITYVPEMIVKTFISLPEGKAGEIEDKIKDQFSENRIVNTNGNVSEYYRIPLQTLYNFLMPLIIDQNLTSQTNGYTIQEFKHSMNHILNVWNKISPNICLANKESNYDSKNNDSKDDKSENKEAFPQNLITEKFSFEKSWNPSWNLRGIEDKALFQYGKINMFIDKTSGLVVYNNAEILAQQLDEIKRDRIVLYGIWNNDSQSVTTLSVPDKRRMNVLLELRSCRFIYGNNSSTPGEKCGKLLLQNSQVFDLEGMYRKIEYKGCLLCKKHKNQVSKMLTKKKNEKK